MPTERNRPEPLVDGNKNETEIPIGDAPAAEARDESMWRCGDCGAMRALGDDLPEECPDCGARKERLFYWAED